MVEVIQIHSSCFNLSSCLSSKLVFGLEKRRIFFMAFTFWVPTFGLIDFLIFHLIGGGFLQTLLSWTLALLVSGPGTMMLVYFLTNNKRE